ncbi:MAG TPA: response regulator [Polyangiaceae bacterium]
MTASYAAQRHIHRILLVEDDQALRASIRRGLRSTGHEIVEADTLASALALLPTGFDLVLLDVRLPDGSGAELAAVASRMLPAPLVVVLSGEATAQEAFTLAQVGVVQFMPKPFSIRELLLAIEHAAASDLHFEPIVKTYVGRQDLRDVQDGVRSTMVNEALAMSGGNKTDAAKLLRVTRQAVQKFMRQGRRTPDGTGGT